METIGELVVAIKSLEKRVEDRFLSQGTAVDAALLAAKEAVHKAEVATEKRFESVNEFRASLKDQQSTFITRVEADVRFDAVNEAIARMSERISIVMSHQTQISSKSQAFKEGWGYLMGLAGLILALTVFIFK